MLARELTPKEVLVVIAFLMTFRLDSKMRVTAVKYRSITEGFVWMPRFSCLEPLQDGLPFMNESIADLWRQESDQSARHN